MGKKSITSAIFRDSAGTCRVISVKDMSKEIYTIKYRDHLFCPNEKCNARLKFVARKNATVKMFQAINIHEHVDDCPYYFQYIKYDSEEKINRFFSDEHIISALQRQFEKYGVDDILKPRDIFRSYSPRKKINNEPYIQSYNCNAIDEHLVKKAIAVIGEISSVRIVDGIPQKIHAYLNFAMSDNRKMSILISNNRYKKEPNTTEWVNQIKSGWENTPDGKRFVCICFGFIQKVKKGINVVPVNHYSLNYGYKNK